jgi:hypothetical protein
MQYLSTLEESEYNSTNDEIDDNKFNANYIQFAAKVSKPIIKLIKMIIRNHKNAFPI